MSAFGKCIKAYRVAVELDHVRCGLPVILKVGNDFRSFPNNGHVTTASACPFRAKTRSGSVHCGKGGTRSFRHPRYPVRVLISLNVSPSPKAQPVHNNRDALGGVDLSRDRPSLSGFFNPSRHRMACHQGAMCPYIIRVLLHSNFRPQGTILVSTSQEMRNCHSILGHKNTRIEGAQPQTNLELFYRGVFVTEPKLNIPVPNSCNGQIWIEAYSPRQ